MRINRTLNFNNLSIDEIKVLDRIIDDIKDDYHALISRIHKLSDNSIYWHVNNLLSRNNSMSSLFYDLCCIELVKKIDDSKPLTTVIVKNICQKKTLERYFQSRNQDISVLSNESSMSRLKRLLKPMYDFLRNIQWSLVYFKEKDKTRNKKISRDQKITLIYTFFSTYIFKTGAFQERYYNGLIDYLTPEERKNVYFVPNVITWRNLNQILKMSEQARENFLYPLDFLKPGDYLFALAAPFAIKRIRLKNFVFRGVDISRILKEDFRSNLSRRSSFRGILLYRLFKRLKQEGIQLNLVIDWFENQVVDRGFNKGKNDFFGDILSIGYQGLIAPYKWIFHLQPTSDEVKAGVIPQQIAVIGDGLIDIVGKYCPELNIGTAPGLRFSDIYKTGIKTAEQFNPSRPVILAALPIWVKDSIEILDLLLDTREVLRQNNAEVIVKPHPSLDFKTVKSDLSHWPDMFKTADGNFSELIEKTDLLVSSGSTVCIESIAYGVPVIVVGSRTGVTKNIIPETVSKDIWDLCYTKEELVNALNRLCFHLTENDRKRFPFLAENIRRDYFMPVSRENVENFLRLNKT